jgi:hypothetical protein
VTYEDQRGARSFAVQNAQSLKVRDPEEKWLVRV